MSKLVADPKTAEQFCDKVKLDVINAIKFSAAFFTKEEISHFVTETLSRL